MEQQTMTEFREGEAVECRHGPAVVTYCEDGFLEIRLDKDGTERTFWAPFDGKVWYPEPKPGHDIWDEIVADPCMAETLEAARIFAAAASAMVSMAGGKASAWEELTARQQMNFVAVSTGIPAEFWEEAHATGQLSSIAHGASRPGR